MSKVFTPYEGCAEDITTVVAGLRDHPLEVELAARRLFAAISEPTCGKVLRDSLGNEMWRCVKGKPHVITCTLPADHDCPHADKTLDGAWS